jgi:glutamyl-tRNA synthetase
MAEPCGDASVPSEPPLPLPAHVAALLEAGVASRGQGYRGRFAPSPTGALHRGNLRTALVGWLEARLRGGGMAPAHR